MNGSGNAQSDGDPVENPLRLTSGECAGGQGASSRDESALFQGAPRAGSVDRACLGNFYAFPAMTGTMFAASPDKIWQRSAQVRYRHE